MEGHEQPKAYITKYCKSMSGEPEQGNFAMNESRSEDIPQISDEENAHLTAPYIEDEVKKKCAFPNGT
jgi:hypothetical protein